VSSSFGPRGETHHDGIDIAAPIGTPVRAARGGRVLYSDELRGYGNLLIIEHGDGYATVYAHNRANLVKTGAAVRQGEVVAEVGETGDSSQPNLHFEVRQQNVARNPVYYLPARRRRATSNPSQADKASDPRHPRLPETGHRLQGHHAAAPGCHRVRDVVGALVDPYRGRVDSVLGIESRGFIIGAAAALVLGTGIAIVRKPDGCRSVPRQLRARVRIRTRSRSTTTRSGAGTGCS
jgi:hypothetical protein